MILDWMEFKGRICVMIDDLMIYVDMFAIIMLLATNINVSNSYLIMICFIYIHLYIILWINTWITIYNNFNIYLFIYLLYILIQDVPLPV